MSSPGPRRVVLLTAQTVDETTSISVYCADYLCHTFFLTGTGTTSSGVITIEEADWDANTGMPYSGTWSTITTLNASDVTGGATKAYHVAAPSAFGWLRARISTVIGGGGDISVTLRSH